MGHVSRTCLQCVSWQIKQRQLTRNRYFNNPRGLLLGIVTAALFLPAIVCSFVGDYLCTRFGRKITVYIGSVLIIVGAIWNALATDLGQFAGGQ